MKKQEIIKLYEAGLPVRAIQKQLGISSPSLVHHHIKKYRRDGSDGVARVTIGRLRELLPRERKPIYEKDAYDEANSLLCAGWNACRSEFLKALEHEGYVFKEAQQENSKQGLSYPRNSMTNKTLIIIKEFKKEFIQEHNPDEPRFLRGLHVGEIEEWLTKQLSDFERAIQEELVEELEKKSEHKNGCTYKWDKCKCGVSYLNFKDAIRVIEGSPTMVEMFDEAANEKRK